MKTAVPIAPVDCSPLEESTVAIEDQNKAGEPAAPIESVPLVVTPVTTEVETKTAASVTPIDVEPVGDSPRTIEDEKKTTEPTAPVDTLPTETPSVTVEDNRKTAELVAPIDAISAKEPPKTGSVAEARDSQSCRLCGATVPKSFQTCPVCNANLIETAPPPEQMQPAAEPSDAKHPEESTIPAGEGEKKAVKPIRKRRLKSAK
jgi:hypothetical protein